jgi:iron complex outermembrane receptor protein
MFRPALACRTRCPVLLLAPLLGLPYPANAEEAPTALPEMTVEGEASAGPMLYQVDLEQAPVTTPDTATLLRRAPGANVNRNGPLTGIAQYRGMFGDRVNVMVNGIRINTGGPNGMDPALSYIPRNQLQSLEVIRGIAPVSSGAETIGGTIIANRLSGEFGPSDELTPSIDFTGGGATVNDSGNASALGSIANRNHRLHVIGSRENGGNIEYSNGKIKPSRHERNNFGGGYGFRTGAHEFSLDVTRNETDPTGTPALPMDIIDINTSIVQGGYSGEIGGYRVNAKAFWTDVNHHMSNFELRDPYPNPNMTRLNDATSSGLGYRLDVAVPFASGTLTLGVDGHQDEHDSTITDPVNNANFRVENFNDVERDVYGLFAEWNGRVATDWNLQLGGRYNRVENDAGDVYTSMAMGGNTAEILQDRFNAADRNKTDNNFDLVAKLSHVLDTSTTVIIEAGRKTRSPSYQERYLWMPMEATNGLADGNVYVGDINLDPEKAYEVGLGLDWYGSRAYVEPRAFYRYVDDYIQGTPFQDTPVLQFSNVDAKLYGADAAWGVALTDNWSLDGIVSYVRGKRDDISDELYRIAPLNGRASITYRNSRWWASLEGVAYAEQDQVSDTNDEQETDGYQLLNLRGGIEVARDLFIDAGVENILDSTAGDHLAGINRVADSDVGLLRRLPSPGRNFFATLQYRYD